MASASEFFGLDESQRSAYTAICLDQLQYRIVLGPRHTPAASHPRFLSFLSPPISTPIEFIPFRLVFAFKLLTFADFDGRLFLSDVRYGSLSPLLPFASQG